MELIFYRDSFSEKIFELSSQGTKGAGAFVASNPVKEEYRVVPKKSRLPQLTSRSNLFSPFPFRSTYHPGADALHHKARRTSTRTRASLHRSLTTIPSRITFESLTEHDTFAQRVTPKDNTTLTMRQNTRCQRARV